MDEVAVDCAEADEGDEDGGFWVGCAEEAELVIAEDPTAEEELDEVSDLIGAVDDDALGVGDSANEDDASDEAIDDTVSDEREAAVDDDTAEEERGGTSDDGGVTVEVSGEGMMELIGDEVKLLSTNDELVILDELDGISGDDDGEAELLASAKVDGLVEASLEEEVVEVALSLVIADEDVMELFVSAQPRGQLDVLFAL